MPNVSVEPMRAFAQQVFERIGTSASGAAVVSDHLVESSLRGMHSHGLIRIPQYLDEAESGAFDPAGMPAIETHHGGRVRIAGNRAFGQIGGVLAAVEALNPASEFGCALVTATNLGHTGRIGAYAETVGRAGLVSIWFASGTGLSGRRVAPFRAREPRLATNPIAYSLPRAQSPWSPTSLRVPALRGSCAHLGIEVCRPRPECSWTMPDVRVGIQMYCIKTPRARSHYSAARYTATKASH